MHSSSLCYVAPYAAVCLQQQDAAVSKRRCDQELAATPCQELPAACQGLAAPSQALPAAPYQAFTATCQGLAATPSQAVASAASQAVAPAPSCGAN